MKRGEDLHRQLYDKLCGRPLTLEEPHTQVARWFVDYANRPQYRTHLHGRTPGEVFMEGRGAALSSQDMQKLALFMMQKEVRTITKDGIRVNGRLYWHEKLYSRRHPVLVRYDEHFNPYSVFVYTLDGESLCEAKDRDHYRIASGLHPVARILGTAEQQEELRAGIELKKGLEKSSSALMRGILQASVLPETQARIAALEAETVAMLPEKPKTANDYPLEAHGYAGRGSRLGESQGAGPRSHAGRPGLHAFGPPALEGFAGTLRLPVRREVRAGTGTCSGGPSLDGSLRGNAGI